MGLKHRMKQLMRLPVEVGQRFKVDILPRHFRWAVSHTLYMPVCGAHLKPFEVVATLATPTFSYSDKVTRWEGDRLDG